MCFHSFALAISQLYITCALAKVTLLPEQFNATFARPKPVFDALFLSVIYSCRYMYTYNCNILIEHAQYARGKNHHGRAGRAASYGLELGEYTSNSNSKCISTGGERAALCLDITQIAIISTETNSFRWAYSSCRYTQCVDINVGLLIGGEKMEGSVGNCSLTVPFSRCHTKTCGPGLDYSHSLSV